MRLENSLATWELREEIAKSIREQEKLKATVEEQEAALTTLEAVPHGNLPRVEVGSRAAGPYVVFGGMAFKHGCCC